jgi:hypothetical protein
MEAVFDRSTNAGIATAGEEITDVNPAQQYRPTRRNDLLIAAIGAASFLVLLVLGLALRDYLSRRGELGHAIQRPSTTTPTTPVVVVPIAPPEPEQKAILPESLETAAQPPPQYTLQEPILLEARHSKHTTARPKGTSAQRAMPSMRLTERDFLDVDPMATRHAPTRVIERDAFDIDLRTLRRAPNREPNREIDREDPYKP